MFAGMDPRMYRMDPRMMVDPRMMPGSMRGDGRDGRVDMDPRQQVPPNGYPYPPSRDSRDYFDERAAQEFYSVPGYPPHMYENAYYRNGSGDRAEPRDRVERGDRHNERGGFRGDRGGRGDRYRNDIDLSSSGTAYRANYRDNHNDRYDRGGMGHGREDKGMGLPQGPPASTLLEEFRSNLKNRKMEVKDIEGHVVEFSQDQHGSRFIQQKLEIASVDEKNFIFEELRSEALNLMTDVFGNYVIQKFFDHGTEEQKKTLAAQLEGHIVTLALQMYGCRVIQKALEVVEPEMQAKLMKELEGQVIKCVKDQNGNHVIQKCLEQVKPPLNNFIVESFAGQVYALATHPYGCRVIQRVLEHCSNLPQAAPILEEILSSCDSLVQDQYGNYVVQHVLEHGSLEPRTLLIEKIRSRILPYSQHKFASNVVERCMQFGTNSERRILVSTILAPDADGIIPLEIMMKDPYANYVVQKLLDITDADQRDLIVESIKGQAAHLRKFTYGKHILARLEKMG
jgi:hypothetical protein